MRNVQNRATDALRALQTIQGAAPTATVVWEHPFDVLEGSAEGGMVDEDGEPDETEDEEAEGDDGDIPGIPEDERLRPRGLI